MNLFLVISLSPYHAWNYYDVDDCMFRFWAPIFQAHVRGPISCSQDSGKNGKSAVQGGSEQRTGSGLPVASKSEILSRDAVSFVEARHLNKGATIAEVHPRRNFWECSKVLWTNLEIWQVCVRCAKFIPAANAGFQTCQVQTCCFSG